MNELSLNSITIDTDISYEFCTLRIYLEDSFFFQKLLLETRPLPSRKKEKTHILNDQISFLLPRPEQFVKFEVIFHRSSSLGRPNMLLALPSSVSIQIENVANLPQPQSQSQTPVPPLSPIVIQHYSLIPDLNGSHGKVSIVAHPPIPRTQIDVNYELKTNVQKTFEDEKEFAVTEQVDQNSSMLEIMTVTNKFLKKVTPLRRFQSDVERLMAQKDLIIDFLILVYLLALIDYGNQVIFSTFFILLFSQFKYRVRFMVVEKSIGYFYKEDTAWEVKKNLEFIKKTQVQLLDFLAKVKKLVYEKNREQLYLLTTFGLTGAFVAFMVLYNTPLSYLLKGAVVGAILGKYKIELAELGQFSKEKSLEVAILLEHKFTTTKQKLTEKLQNNKTFVFIQKISKLWQPKFSFFSLSGLVKNFQAEKNTKTQPIITSDLEKTCFAYEYQRFYMNVGWANGVMGNRILIRKTDVLR